MRASILLVCLLFVAAFAVDPICYSTKLACADVNGACGISTDSNSNTITYTNCKPGSYCSGFVTGTCTAYLGSGANCTSGVCGSGLGCSNFTCQTIQTVGLGSKCDEAFLCQTTAYCSPLNETCVASAAVGGDCSGGQTGYNCVPGAFCPYWATNPTCQNDFSVANGGTCSENFNCNVGSLCVLTNSGNTSNPGTCTAQASNSGASCTADQEGTQGSCPSGNTCEYSKCSSGTAQYTCQVTLGNSNSDQSNEQAFAKCQNSNTGDVCHSTATCKNCQSQACNADFITYLQEKDNCGNGVCNNQGGSAGMVVASFALVVAALFVSM